MFTVFAMQTREGHISTLACLLSNYSRSYLSSPACLLPNYSRLSVIRAGPPPQLLNRELYSSPIREFHLLGANKYPAESQWKQLGRFEMGPHRTTQVSVIESHSGPADMTCYLFPLRLLKYQNLHCHPKNKNIIRVEKCQRLFYLQQNVDNFFSPPSIYRSIVLLL